MIKAGSDSAPREAQLALTETDDGDLGLIPSRRSWPTHFIGEIRKCRFRNGIYVCLPMRDMLELLTDVDVSILDQIIPALQTSLERVKVAIPPSRPSL